MPQSEQFSRSSCLPQELLLQHVMQAESLSEQQCEEVIEHVAHCSRCAEIYDALCEFEEELWDEAVDNAGLPKRELHFTRSPQEGLADLWRRIEETEGRPRKKRRATIFRIGKFAAGIAACLTMLIAGRWMLGAQPKPLSVISNSTALAVQTASKTDDTLLSLRLDSVHRPLSPDLDTLEYASWRDSHRDWFAQQFPWIFKVQTAMQKLPAFQADYIELLMVSGDIWQFYYDPKGPATQPYTKIEPAAIARLARYYHSNEQEMMKAVGLAASAPIATVRAADSMAAQEYAKALRRWHDTLGMAGSNTQESIVGVAMVSLTASGYLGNMRTAAYLWSKANPQKSVELLADDSFIKIALVSPGEVGWITHLRNQSVAARSSNQMALEWLAMPTNDCEHQIVQRKMLEAIVAELVPSRMDF